jgi:septum formation protein
MRRLVLASTSPRRRDLLALLGIPFDILDPIYEERLVSDRSADELVRAFAQCKADSVAQRDPDAWSWPAIR